MKNKLSKNSSCWRLFFIGAKTTGNFQDTLSYIEENLTGKEYNALQSFFDWCTKNNKKFGHGNYWDVYSQFLNETDLP